MLMCRLSFILPVLLLFPVSLFLGSCICIPYLYSILIEKVVCYQSDLLLSQTAFTETGTELKSGISLNINMSPFLRNESVLRVILPQYPIFGKTECSKKHERHKHAQERNRVPQPCLHCRHG